MLIHLETIILQLILFLVHVKIYLPKFKKVQAIFFILI